MAKGLKFTIKTANGNRAHSIVIGLHNALSLMANELQAVRHLHPHENLLFLHAVELKAMFAKLADNKQSKYTFTLTELQAEAYRNLFARIELKYEQYGAIWVQWLLDEVNRYCPPEKPMIAAPG